MVSTRDMTNFFVSDALQQQILYHVDGGYDEIRLPLKNLTGKGSKNAR